MVPASPILRRACAGPWESPVWKVCGAARCPMWFLREQKPASLLITHQLWWFWITATNLSRMLPMRFGWSVTFTAAVTVSIRLTAKKSVCAMSMISSWILDWDEIPSPSFPKGRLRKSSTASQRNVGQSLKKLLECLSIRHVVRKRKASLVKLRIIWIDWKTLSTSWRARSSPWRSRLKLLSASWVWMVSAESFTWMFWSLSWQLIRKSWSRLKKI